mmetsp:Transcript_2573/g.2493  ORF Transcript_2573/g.2493 Transcript_2573/m.2493 type:complete len:98 (+) Transcript_2573:1070-1363(+)
MSGSGSVQKHKRNLSSEKRGTSKRKASKNKNLPLKGNETKKRTSQTGSPNENYNPMGNDLISINTQRRQCEDFLAKGKENLIYVEGFGETKRALSTH